MNNKTKNELNNEAVETVVSTDAAMTQTINDFKNSALLVSVLVNMFILTTWLVLQVTDMYNPAIIGYLQN